MNPARAIKTSTCGRGADPVRSRRPALKTTARAMALLLALSTLCGCITPGHVPAKTTSNYAGQPLQSLVIVRDTMEPRGAMEISKSARGYKPAIYESDKVFARRQAMQFSKALREQIDQRLGEDAATQGLRLLAVTQDTLAQAPADWPRMNLHVETAHFICESGCLMYYWVKAQLLVSAGADQQAWSGWIRIAQRLGDTEPVDAMYQDLLKQLLAAMRKDGVL